MTITEIIESISLDEIKLDEEFLRKIQEAVEKALQNEGADE